MTGVQDDNSQPPHERGSTRFFGRRRVLQTPSEALHPEAALPPPSAPNSERRPVLSALSGLLSLSLVGAFVALFAVAFASRTLNEKGPLAADKVVFVAPGSEVVQIIDKLNKEGVINHPTLVKATLWATRQWRKVKAGEYLFKANVSHQEVIRTLVAGKQLLHSVTIPEGLTSEQIVERLRANKVLAGDIKTIPEEGSLLPETYKVTRGSSRSRLIDKMTRDQDRMLTRIWNKRSKQLPLKTKFELLTLAAIVEKETGRADERSRVAAVFLNRLRKGMRLQSDPTIVYGLVGGKGTLGRSILKTEIRKPTPYNTYVIPALPPGPIANPGRAALEATANPSQTDDLFFVADGTGGHAFAKTLADHNRNVLRWRQIEKERAAKAKEDGSSGTGAGSPAADVDRVQPDAEPETRPKLRGRQRGDLFQISPFFGAPTAAATTATPMEYAVARLVLTEALSKYVHKSADGSAAGKFKPVRRKVATSAAAGKLKSKTLPENKTLPESKALVNARAAIAAAAPKGDAPKTGVGLAYAPVAEIVPEKTKTALPVRIEVSAIAKDVRTKVVSTRNASAEPSIGKPGAAVSGSKPGAKSGKTMQIKLASGVESLNLQIIGVTPDVTDSPLDGPIVSDNGPDPEIDTSKIATAPMSAGKRADMASRIAKFGGNMPFRGGDIETTAQTIPDFVKVPAGHKSAAKNRMRTAKLGKGRRPIYDASAGTKLDPLKARRWDLNSAHVVPRLK